MSTCHQQRSKKFLYTTSEVICLVPFMLFTTVFIFLSSTYACSPSLHSRLWKPPLARITYNFFTITHTRTAQRFKSTFHRSLWPPLHLLLVSCFSPHPSSLLSSPLCLALIPPVISPSRLSSLCHAVMLIYRQTGVNMWKSRGKTVM